MDALAKVSGLTVANTSQHLQQLRQAGLVVNRKEGHKVFYRLSGDDVAALLGSLREVAERHLADVDRLVDDYLKVKDSLEPVPAVELLERALIHPTRLPRGLLRSHPFLFENHL